MNLNTTTTEKNANVSEDDVLSTAENPDGDDHWTRMLRVVREGMPSGEAVAFAAHGIRPERHLDRELALWSRAATAAVRLDMNALVRYAIQRRLPAGHARVTAGPEPDISHMLAALASADIDKWHAETRISMLIAGVKRLDVPFIRDFVLRLYEEMGPEAFITVIALPLLQRVGKLWALREISVAGEHLISSVLRAILEADLLRAGFAPGAEKLLVTTPYGENHEIGVLCAAVLASHHGFEVIFAGAQLPAYEIARVCMQHDVRMLCMGGSYLMPDLAGQQLEQVIQLLPRDVLILTGGPTYRAHLAGPNPTVRHFASMTLFSCELEVIAWLLCQRHRPSAPL